VNFIFFGFDPPAGSIAHRSFPIAGSGCDVEGRSDCRSLFYVFRQKIETWPFAFKDNKRRISMQKKFLLSFLFLISFFALCSAPVHSALFNGSFELGEYKGTDLYQTIGATTSDVINNWTVSSIEWIQNYWKAYDGTYSIDLNGNDTGTITQTFVTAPKQQYKVTFWMAGNPDDGIDKVKELKAAADGTTQDFSFDATGKTQNNMGWAERSFLFTAADKLTTLTFTSLETGGFGPALDNVSVAAVPIPAAAWLLGTGLIGLVVIRQRKLWK
jgi:choice-of-anchor C domain-containing protein